MNTLFNSLLKFYINNDEGLRTGPNLFYNYLFSLLLSGILPLKLFGGNRV